MMSAATDQHLVRMKTLYMADLVAAIEQCHENFLLLQKNLSTVNRQLELRQHAPDQLMRTETGLVQEYAHHLQTAMQDVLSAVEEHFSAEMRQTQTACPDAVWTATETMMARPGATGGALLGQLAALVGEERRALQALDSGYSVDEDLSKFQVTADLDGLVEAEQARHVRAFLRARDNHAAAGRAERAAAAGREEYLGLLRSAAAAAGVTDGRRDLEEDWRRGVDERLEVAAMQAEAGCLERRREELQRHAKALSSAQESLASSRLASSRLRQQVQRHQAAVRSLTRRNADGRRQLSATRADVARLADQVGAQLVRLREELAAGRAASQQAVQRVERAASPQPLPPPPTVSADEVVARLARQLVAEREARVGGHDFRRMLHSLRDRTEALRSAKLDDERHAAETANHKRPLAVLARRERLTGEEHAREVGRVKEERTAVGKL